MTFGSTFGRVFSPTFQPKSQAAATASSWWLAGGIAAANCIAAYQPKGAASYAASKVNLANPGTHDAADGSTYPTWDFTDGWSFASGKYLVLPKFALTYTIICKYTDASGTNAVLFGTLNTAGTAGTYYMPTRTGNTRTHVNGANNNDGVVAISKPSGVVAIAGNKAYFDGSDLGVTLSTSALPDLNLYLGRINFSNPLSVTAKVQALAIYDITLTPSQIAAVTTAMIDKPGTPNTDADIFMIAGQSNGSGYVANNQAYSHPSLIAWNYAKDYKFHRLADPISDNSGAVEAAMVDTSGATKGSVWPLVATAIMERTGREVIFAPCAIGGEGLSEYWQPSADHHDTATNYGCLLTRAEAVAPYGNLRAVLLWAGEGEVHTSMSQVDYNANLDAFADAIRTDLGIPTIACKLQDCSGMGGGNDETNVNAAVAEAWSDNANCLVGPDLHEITTDDQWHIISDAKAQQAATLWANAIIDAFGW